MNAKRAAVRFLGLALGLFLAQTAAAQVSDKDALTVTITPNAYYAVVITTTAPNSLNLGLVNLAASTYTVRPATVTITSTFASTDLTLEGRMLSGNWSFDANTASNEADSLQAWALFTDTGAASVPADAFFTGSVPGANDSDVFDAVARGVDDPTGGIDENNFTLVPGNANYKSMEDLPNAGGTASSHLWFKFRLPSATTSTGAHNIQVILTAVAPN